MIKFTKKDIKDLINKEELEYRLANEIVESKKNGFNEFEKELTNALREATKEIVKEWLDSYLGENKVRSDIREVMKNMTKKEIIELLADEEGIFTS